MNKKILTISIIATAFIVTCLLAIYAFTNKAYKIGTEDIRMSEIEYSAVKSELITQVDTYIKSVAPESGLKAFLVVEKCEEEQIDIAFVLAQAELESHFGTKGIASKTNSVWNVGSFDNLSYKEILKEYKYRDPNESITPYLRLLKSRYLTSKTEEGLMNHFVDLNGKRYATDVHYEERLKFRYDVIKEATKIDSLQTKMNYWAIKANRW